VVYQHSECVRSPAVIDRDDKWFDAPEHHRSERIETVKRGNAMPDTPQSVSTLLAGIERLLLHGEPDAMLDMCYFGVRLGGGRVILKIAPTVEHARGWFATDGQQFFEPMQYTNASFRRKSDGTITDYTSYARPESKPPILSTESVPDLGDENHVWRGYGNNQRGVIKMRVGRFLADLNMPTVDDAERYARRLADVLRAG
jgi:hypothetical protein